MPAQATRSKASLCAPPLPEIMAFSVMAALNSLLFHGMDGSYSTSSMAMTFLVASFWYTRSVPVVYLSHLLRAIAHA